MLQVNQAYNNLNFLEKSTKDNSGAGKSFQEYLSEEAKVSNCSTSLLKLNELSSGSAATAEGAGNGSKRIYLGKITAQIPTVSELLYSSPYKKKCWQILDRGVNAAKPFRQIQPGTDIYLDTKTSEIIWGEKKAYQSVEKTDFLKNESGLKPEFRSPDPSVPKYSMDESRPRAQLKKELQSFPEPALNHVVSKFIGRDYEQMDCYEMVVEGLKDLGVNYQGRNGLGKHLINKAVGNGLPYNHYLNGEGLLEAAGQDVYHKKFFSVKDPHAQSKAVMHEMEKVLKEGQILSFSTQTRGHTGVVSRKDNTWTFINSGTMDNNIAGKNGLKAVGEEILSKELDNWFKLAKSKKEGLQITLGDIDMTKLAMYRDSDFIHPNFTIPG